MINSNNTIFKEEDLIFLRDLKIKGRVQHYECQMVIEIGKKIDPNFSICCTCNSAASHSINNIMLRAEKFIGCDLLDYEGRIIKKKKVTGEGKKNKKNKKKIVRTGRDRIK